MRHAIFPSRPYAGSFALIQRAREDEARMRSFIDGSDDDAPEEAEHEDHVECMCTACAMRNYPEDYA